MKLSKLKKNEYLWLRYSDFYKNLDDELDGDIEIIYCSIFEKNPFLILDVINIWGVNFIPKEILNTIFNFSTKLQVINKLKSLHEITNSNFYKLIIDFLENKISDALNESAKNGFLDLLIYFSDKYLGMKKYVQMLQKMVI